MPTFRFGQQATGNVYSRNSRQGNATTRRRSQVTANIPSSTLSGQTSAQGGAGQGSGGYNVNRFNPAYDRLEEGSVVEDWIPRDLPGINKMFRIIYTRDPVCGPAIDIMSQLPWSDFDIQGIEDDYIRKFYEEAASVFGDRAQEMAAITTEYLVLGRFCASMIYDDSKGYWTDFVPHDSDFLQITPIPVRGFDPKIDLVLSPGVRQFVNSPDYRDIAAMETIPEDLLSAMRAGRPIPLDPLSTLYLRRKTSPYDFVGTSILSRILVYWALEKALINASVTAARRRAGNILHITAGLEDKWEPTADEMDDIAGLFIQADEDPVGAVVATRTGVEATEIRQGGDLWKWTDEWQTLSEGKMRGLGVSEAIMNSDSSYANMETARSIFTDQVLQLRAHLTNEVYYKRLKILARAHGFRKQTKANLDHRVRIDKGRDAPTLENLSQEEAMDIPEEDLIVPNIHWRKSLLPEGDREYLDILQMISEQGVPIPLKVWAARAGYDIEEAVDMLDEDLELRDKIKAWKGKTGGGGGEDQDAWGKAEDTSQFWDRGEQFMELRKSEARECLKSLAETIQKGHHEVLADAEYVERECYRILGNERKLELMKYILLRLGLNRGSNVAASALEDIVDYFRTKPMDERRRHQELAFLAKLGVRGRQDEFGDLAAGMLKQDKAFRNQFRASSGIPSQSPSLLSGVA